MLCSCTPERDEPHRHTFAPDVARDDADQQRSQPVQRVFVMDDHIRAMNMRRVSATLLLSVCLCLVAAAAQRQSPADAAYTEVFYPSGSLRIQAYLYKPHGDGPFPVVIYNHGSRPGRER